MKCVRVVISGRVQGVAYRAWTERTARELGLTGWVRNRRDGTVEASFCGNADLVDEMIHRCHSGPRLARADAVTIEDMPGEPRPTVFEVRETI